MLSSWRAKPPWSQGDLKQPECEKDHDSCSASHSPKDGRHRVRKAPTTGEAWMSFLDDDMSSSAFTIPGTHDSAAYTYKIPFITTQALDIHRQLDAGIRYFDLRCGLREDIVEMVHGTAILGLKLEEVLLTMYIWLLNHPTEGIIAQIKRDRQEESSTVNFARGIVNLIEAKPERWRTANTTPTMGELRGKIQLFRRFSGPGLCAFGLDVTRWQDNPERPFTIHTWHNTQLTIQDHYSFPDPLPLPSLITAKGGAISQLLDLAAQDPDPEHWYMNFTSGFEFNLYYQIPPKKLALGGWWIFRWEDGINTQLRGYLSTVQEQRRLGIIAMDFPEQGAADLIMAVVRTNFRHASQSTRGNRALATLALILMLLSATMFSLAFDWPSGYWRLFNMDLCSQPLIAITPLICRLN